MPMISLFSLCLAELCRHTHALVLVLKQYGSNLMINYASRHSLNKGEKVMVKVQQTERQ